ncbi:energy-coupling factor transporter transmembrane component T [Thermosyntropha sp.]|uniref:energy-coupling factor transporter transmembrane component T family protein n=1 Tax=Thermosyntropha sp. TaxID=2740820 RepID=UPI0025D4260A|nr:energy-coupling factor transporter transmembrane component T [Thermosyntropha sp.]MBO8158072.1 energy-coupling factor transporter transmembrane protein EcfT [Thermosyntropha sp.]
MVKNIGLGQYIPGNSILHRLDPRSKVIGTVILVVGTFTSAYPVETGIFLGTVLILGALSQVGIRYYFDSLKPLLYLILITAFFQVLLAEEELGQRFDAALNLGLRLFIIIFSMQVLMGTTSPLSLTSGMEKMLSPLKRIKFPVHELIMIMTISLRFIPLYIEDWERIKKAQMSRGINFEEKSIIKRLKNYISVLIPLLRISFQRAVDLATAMESRCYQGEGERSHLNVLKFTPYDFMYIGIIGGVWLITIWL